MRTYKLKEITNRIFSGGTPSTTRPDYWDGDLNWLSSGETRNPFIKSTEKKITAIGVSNSSTRLAHVGDTVIASAGQGCTRGQTSFLKINTYINQSIVALEPNKQFIVSEYLFYNLSNRYDEMRLLSDSSSTRGSITTKMISDMTINLPNINDQQHIVNTIGSIDDLIENYQQEIDKICELLDKSLLKYPNRVEISSYNPKIIKSGINSFFNSKEYLDTSSVEGVNNISAGEEITICKRPSRANMQPVKNSVWFAKMKGSCKKLIITADDFDLMYHYILSTGFQGLLSTKQLPLSLLSAFVISKDFDVQRDLHSVGTTMAGINNETFMKMLVPQLSIQEIEEFDKKYSSLVKLLSKRRKEITKLKTIKQQLLQIYF